MERIRLLDDVVTACAGGVAEAAPEDQETFLRNFLIVPRHLRALDPQVRLVIGDKGAGKSQLFQALTYGEGRELLGDSAKAHKYPCPPLSRTHWLVGFTLQGQAFPPPDVIDALVRSYHHDPQHVRLWWLALLVKVLLDADHFHPAELGAELRDALDRAAHEPARAVEVLRVGGGAGKAFEALDRLDRTLTEEERYIFLAYDELDRVSPGDWQIVSAVLKGLTQFWAAHSRRWQRLRCKVFLRADMLERGGLQGPDIAKLAWRPAELLWEVTDLYRMLFTRLANASRPLRNYLRQGGLELAQTAPQRWRPVGAGEDDFADTVAHVFGEHMGPDPRKGLTWRWIPNHVKDGHGRVYPRPLLRLVERAAQLEQRNPKADQPNLIHHTALRGALDTVSEFRVKELTDEEFRWMERVQRAFRERPFVVPAAQREVLRSLRIDWDKEAARPPETEPDGLLDYLVELGIASRRTDGRIDVGDLYLKGLHLKRKGGPKRPLPV
jgi:hypothetical protein